MKAPFTIDIQLFFFRMEANQEIESTKTLLSGMEQDKLDLESQLQRLQAQNTEQREKVNNGGSN